MEIQHSNHKPKVEKGINNETLSLQSHPSLSNKRTKAKKRHRPNNTKIMQLLNLCFLKNNQIPAGNYAMPHIHNTLYSFHVNYQQVKFTFSIL